MFLGLADQDTEFIKGRLEFSQEAIIEPFTLISTFLTLEKTWRFKQVENEITNLSSVLQILRYPARGAHDLIGSYTRVARLKNALKSWKKEIELLIPHQGDFKEPPPQPSGTPANNPAQPAVLSKDTLDIPEYLERTVNEYQTKIRSCDVVLNATSLAFQMVITPPT